MKIQFFLGDKPKRNEPYMYLYVGGACLDGVFDVVWDGEKIPRHYLALFCKYPNHIVRIYGKTWDDYNKTYRGNIQITSQQLNGSITNYICNAITEVEFIHMCELYDN